MDKVTSEECEWCEGSGVDIEGESMGSPYACVDCKGTGFKHGEEGRVLYNKQMDIKEKELLENV